MCSITCFSYTFIDTAACTPMNTRVGSTNNDDSVVPVVAGILVAIVVLVGVSATVIGVLLW